MPRRAKIAEKDAQIEAKDAEIAANKADIEAKDVELANKDAEIAQQNSDLQLTQRDLEKTKDKFVDVIMTAFLVIDDDATSRDLSHPLSIYLCIYFLTFLFLQALRVLIRPLD